MHAQTPDRFEEDMEFLDEVPQNEPAARNITEPMTHCTDEKSSASRPIAFETPLNTRYTNWYEISRPIRTPLSKEVLSV